MKRSAIRSVLLSMPFLFLIVALSYFAETGQSEAKEPKKVVKAPVPIDEAKLDAILKKYFEAQDAKIDEKLKKLNLAFNAKAAAPAGLTPGRGRKAPSLQVSKARHATSDKKHGARLKALPPATPPTYDARNFGKVGPIKFQSTCGDCYIFSGSGVCESAQYTAGVALSTSGFGLSEQFLLDRPEFDGCAGGDEWSVAQFIMQNGAPSVADYPGLGQIPGNPRDTTGMTLYKISDMGFCTVGAGPNTVANPQDMKNCIVQYGPISVAVDARSWPPLPAPGSPSFGDKVLAGNGFSCDHAVIIVGWDDSKGNGGAWLVRNSWGPTWGMQGYAWVQFDSFLIGTEAFWVKATPVAPVTTPNVPSITSPLSASGPPGVAFSYQIVATNSPSSYAASALPAGLTFDATKGLISGTPTAVGTSSVTISATNASGTSTPATLTLFITTCPPPPPPFPANPNFNANIVEALRYWESIGVLPPAPK